MQQSALARICSRASAAWLVLATGVALSAAAALLVAGQLEHEARLKFDSAVGDAKAAIESRVNAYADVLLGVRGLFIADNFVSRVEFKRYIDSLDLNRRYPGIQGIHYSRPVTAAERPAFEAMVRGDTSVDPRGYPDFAIRPAGNRPEYVVAQYVEPMAGNERALGLDLVGDAVRLAALDRTRESGQLTASGTIALALDPKRYPGFAMRLGLYKRGMPLDTVAQRRAAFSGMVSASFVVIDLMRGVLSEPFLEKVHVRIHDAGFLGSPGGLARRSAENLMFDSDRLHGRVPATQAVWDATMPGLRSEAELAVGGRRWTLYFTARQGFGHAYDRWLPWLVLFGGVTVSLLLFGLVRSLATSSSRAVELAERMTENLRASEETLRATNQQLQMLVQSSPLAIYTRDRDGLLTSWNPAAEKMYGWKASEVLGKPLPTLPDEARAESDGLRMRLLAGEPLMKNESRRLRRDGTPIYIDAFLAPLRDVSGNISGIVAVVADITKRKQAEQALRQSMLVLENTFEFMDQGISIVGADLQMVGMNRRFRELLDFPESMCKPNTPFAAFVRYNAERGDYGPGDVEDQVRTRIELARRFEPHRFERERSDGTILEIRGLPTPGGGFVTLYTDVTQRVRSERALRESEERFRSLTELSSDWYWEQDENFRFLKFSAGADLHDTSSAYVGRTRWELPGVDGSEKRWTEHRVALAAHEAFRNFEFQRLTEGGEVIWVSASGEPIFDGQGVFKGYRGVGSNITERKQAELALRESEARFRSLIALSAEWYWEQDEQWRFVALSADVLAHAGSSRESHIGKTRWELPVVGVTEECWAEHRATLAAHQPFRNFEYQRLSENGDVIWMSVSGEPVFDGQGRFKGYRGVGRNITGRKQAEAALRDSEQRYRALADWSPEAIIVYRDGSVVYVNPAAIALFGATSVSELVGKSIFGLVHPDFQRIARERAIGLAAGGGSNQMAAMRFCRLDGTTIDAEVQGASILYDGAPAIYAIMRDLTERKRTEEDLHASRRLLEQVIDAIPMAIFAKDRNSNYIMVNKYMADFFATSKEELLRRHTSRLPTSEAERRQALKDDAWVFRHRRALDKPETLIEGADGMQVLFHSTKIPLVDSAGELIGLLGINRDISEQKRAEAARASLEAQLRESQKMQAIGTLAGGIAHDFNNIIAAILGNAELARQDVSADSRVRESVEEIRKAAVRGREVVQQILSFSRRQPTARKPIALGPIVEESARLLRATLPARVALEVRCDADVPVALADDTQIEQVLINLATNAMQAMQGGPGRIEIRLDTVLLDAALAGARPGLRALYAAHPGRTLRLAMRDDGPGMDEATLERIFEPFFTTKPQGEGTGLGLSVAHGIVLGHEGAIVVESEPGKGASFTLYLPVAEAEAQANENAARSQAVSNEAAAPAAGAGEHILYLDDDEAMVFLVMRMLQRHGYRVSGYSSPKEALAALKTDPAGFDLVVSDYNMPGISGLEVARAARDIRADLPMAIASGFIDEQLHAQAAGAGVRELIFKADAVEDLCNAIARLARAGSAKAA